MVDFFLAGYENRHIDQDTVTVVMGSFLLIIQPDRSALTQQLLLLMGS